MADILDFFRIDNTWFSIWAYPVSYLEAAGTFFGIVSVYLASRASIHTWSTGIVNVILFFLIYYQVQLYSDMLLQIYFLVMSIYGWVVWQQRKSKESATIRSLSRKEQLYLYQGIIISAVLLGWLIANIHQLLPQMFSKPAAYPLADAFTTTMSVVATVLLARKILQSWILWILVDLVSVVLYWHRGIYLVALEYILFLIIATVGLLQWRKLYVDEQRIGNRKIYAAASGSPGLD
jgi:nicotinamide mononucleotide transporter